MRRFEKARDQLWWVVALGLLVWVNAVGAAAAAQPRGYELVSRSAGKDVMADANRVRVAAQEAPGLPMAAVFPSLGGFGDVAGSGVAVDYISQRDGAPGTSGWNTHAITPRQEPLSFSAVTRGMDPLYLGSFSRDLTRGIFRSWSPLDATPNVQQVPNLYLRDDVRSPGEGSYDLLTPSVSPVPQPLLAAHKPFLAGASPDLTHVLYESRFNLTPDAAGTAVKVYKVDGAGPRLVKALASGCPGSFSSPTCSLSGAGSAGSVSSVLMPHVLSDDGERVSFSSPFDVGAAAPSNTGGVATVLFQLDDQGTASTADDAIVEVSASEKASPDATQAAKYKTASADGSRVFFTSDEQLTDAPGAGLYLWTRQASDETQAVTVDATGGAFSLTAHSQVTYGTGTLTRDDTTVTGVSAGSFSVGQTISGPDIPAGTTIVSMGSFVGSGRRLVLSAPATADATENLTASVDATTPPLAWNASASELQSALEALTGIGVGNVRVSGGPGGSSSYQVTFTGALAGANVAELTADTRGLSGGAQSAVVTTPDPIQNLRLIAPGVSEVIGASEDGHRVYFVAGGQLVAGGPVVNGNGLFLWQEESGRLSFVGDLRQPSDYFTNSLGRLWALIQSTAAVTPDGRHMVFEASDGLGLAPGYVHGACDQNANGTGTSCSEVYLYSADDSTPTDPDLVCASCNLSSPGAPGDTQLRPRSHTGAAATTGRLSRVISDDGQHVFFDTPEPLVPEDTNGHGDAYEYDVATGRAHLISSGTDPADSYLMETTPSGSDVFFLTREQLVGWDRDQSYDLYDARVGGGFPEPVAARAECSDTCQGQPPAAPGLGALGSSLFRGLGNTRAVLHRHRTRAHAPRCKRGRVKRRVHGRARCVKRSDRAARRAHARKGSDR